MKLCECGCGRVVKGRFTRGHNLRISNPGKNPNVAEKIRLANIGRPSPKKGQKGLQVAWNKGTKGSVKPNKTSFTKGHIPWNKEAKGITTGWPKGQPFTEKHKTNLRVSHMGHIPLNKGKRLSAAHRRKVASPENVMKRMLGANIRPNKPERQLIKLILDNELPFRYVGNGNFIIEYKCPDFININGKKQVIELYGDYWHKGEDPQDRINLFAKYGFSTLVIWEHELKEPDTVLSKIKEFIVESARQS